jgi:hypothetical protein
MAAMRAQSHRHFYTCKLQGFSSFLRKKRPSKLAQKWCPTLARKRFIELVPRMADNKFSKPGSLQTASTHTRWFG